MTGCHSPRLVVVTDTFTLALDESVPEARTCVARVAAVNSESSNSPVAMR